MDYRRVAAMRQVWMLGMKLLVIFAVGCDLNPSTPLADTSRDIVHHHGHQHDSGHGHGHDHRDGHTGAHSHGHQHGHRHGDSIRGGKIVSIGHSHHADEVTSFHAEVMPVVAGQISFHLLMGNSETGLQSLETEESEVLAYINRHDDPSLRAQEIVFRSSSGQRDSSTFSATIPDSLSDSRRFTVVVPKVTLGGKRTSFSFDAERRGPPELVGATTKTAEVAP